MWKLLCADSQCSPHHTFIMIMFNSAPIDLSDIIALSATDVTERINKLSNHPHQVCCFYSLSTAVQWYSIQYKSCINFQAK